MINCHILVLLFMDVSMGMLHLCEVCAVCFVWGFSVPYSLSIIHADSPERYSG